MTLKQDAYKPAELREISRLQKIYKISFRDAAELFEFDSKHTDSDKATQKYLSETFGMDSQAIESLFYKIPTAPRENRAKIRKATEKAQERRENRLEYLARTLGALDIFGEATEITNTSLSFTAPETGFGITIKVTRHKVQKVVTKDWTPDLEEISVSDQRVLALHKAIMDKPDLFEAPSFAKTKIGIAERDERYPFASIKITHHKS